MLTTNARVTIPKKVKILGGILLGFGVAAYAVYFIVTTLLPEETVQNTPSSTQAAVNKQTGYDGVKINKNDPQALQQYCDDANTVAKRLGNGSSIKDLCVLSRIANDYLPLMSEQQISEMANNDPTCLTTGFGKDGFDCFTGMDSNGCGRNGLDKDGKECTPIQVASTEPSKASVNDLLANKQQICDLVKGCESDSLFDPQGFNQYGCDRAGKNKDGVPCAYELVTPIYGDNGLNQFGFTSEGFNSKGCDRRGFKADGSRCQVKDITKTYNQENQDIWGFDPKGFNRFGCTVDGLDKDGKVCSLEHITSIVDPVTGMDQFGLIDGYNENGCNLLGLDKDGNRCDLAKSPQIFGKDGINQFGLQKNGRNLNNCDIDGLKPDGSLCNDSEVTRVYDPKTGLDQFNYFKNGRNKFDCDARGFKPNGDVCPIEQRNVRVDPVTGLDAFGLTEDGFNGKGCNVQGLRRDGTRCAITDIPRIFAKNEQGENVDQFGLSEDGFNDKGCNISGFSRDGSRCSLENMPRLFDHNNMDQLGFGKDLFNKHGCDINGLTKQGTLCKNDFITRIYDAQDVDQFGVKRNGFSAETGCNAQGYKEDGTRCSYEDIPKRIDKNGFNQFNLDSTGRNKNGCDINGLKSDGTACLPSETTVLYDDENMNVFHKDPQGFNRMQLNDQGFNALGCDLNGRRANGTLCAVEDIPLVFDPATGLNQFGLTESGFNDKGCNLRGVNAAGVKCEDADIPRIFDADLKDQFGVHIDQLPDDVWLARTQCIESLAPVVNSSGDPVFISGRQAFKDVHGKMKDDQCLDLRSPTGATLYLDKDGTIKNSKGEALSSLSVKTTGSNGNSKLSTSSPSMSPVVNAAGEQLKIDNKRAFALADGSIVDSDGNAILGEDGKPIRLAKSGNVIDSKGSLVDSERLNIPNASLLKQDGTFTSESLPMLTTENGVVVTKNGRPVFVRKNGELVTGDGQKVRDRDGSSVSLSSSGELVNAKGEKISSTSAGLQSSNGDAGRFSRGAQSLSGENGKQVLVNGKPAFVNQAGELVDGNGARLLSKDGKALRLNESGVIVDSDNKTLPESQLNQPNQSLKKASLATPVQGKNGQIVLVNGKPAFVNQAGELVDGNGARLLSKDGKALRLNDSGVIVDEKGEKLPESELNQANGNLKRVTSSSPALTNNGKIATLNGKPIFVGPDNQLITESGQPILSPKGEAMYLGENGQIVDADKEVILVTGIDPNESLSTNKFSKTKSVIGEQARLALDKASLLSEADRIRAGVNSDGFNAKGCALNGLDRSGEQCSIADTPRVFDSNGFDQFGLKRDGFNAFGCNLEGLNRNGEKCTLEQTPRIFNLNGVDQMGTPREGRIPVVDKGVLLDSAGINQFNQSADGADRLGLKDGRNEKGCDLNGLNLKGEICPLSDIPRVFDINSFDQFGLTDDGFNRFGCDLAGKREDGTLCRPDQISRIFDKNNRDQFGLDPQMRNDKGCDTTGFNAKGEVCAFNDIPKILDKNNIDQFGVLPSGFNAAGCNISGFKKDGSRCALSDIPKVTMTDKSAVVRDQFGLDPSGRNIHGCDLSGMNKEGKLCAFDKITKIFDPVSKMDQFGFKETGFNEKGCDFYGYNAKGELCSANVLTQLFDAKGLNQFGVSKDSGRNENGCDMNGKNIDGSTCSPAVQIKFVDKKGVDQFGLKDGINDSGCGLDGLNKDGAICDLSEIPRVIEPLTGLDQFKLDQNGRNEHGCSLAGLDENGNVCEPSKITRIFDKSDKDQFQLNRKGFNDNGCNLLGMMADGTKCRPEKSPAIFGEDGFSQLGFTSEHRDRGNFDVDGFDPDGCDINNRNKDGKQCSKYQNLDLTTDDGTYMTERKTVVDAWVARMKAVTPPKDIQDGTYKYEVEINKAAEMKAQIAAAQATAVASSEDTSSPLAKASAEDKTVKIPMSFMVIADVKTPVNSDYTEDVYASIIGSELDGAILKGGLEIPYLDNPVMPRDKFRYRFTHLIWERKAYTIDAVTISIDNDSGMVDADDVNYHRLQRYGGLLIASAVQSLDATFLDNQAEQNARLQAQAIDGATQQAQLLGQTTDALTRQNLKTATSHINDLAKQQFTRRPTITKGPGQHLVIFNEEVTEEGLPVVFDGIEN